MDVWNCMIAVVSLLLCRIGIRSHDSSHLPQIRKAVRLVFLWMDFRQGFIIFLPYFIFFQTYLTILYSYDIVIFVSYIVEQNRIK